MIMPQIGIGELVVIFLIVIVLFGPRRLPELGRAIGDAIREFKKSLKETGEGTKETKKEDDNKKG